MKIQFQRWPVKGIVRVRSGAVASARAQNMALETVSVMHAASKEDITAHRDDSKPVTREVNRRTDEKTRRAREILLVVGDPGWG